MPISSITQRPSNVGGTLARPPVSGRAWDQTLKPETVISLFITTLHVQAEMWSPFQDNFSSQASERNTRIHYLPVSGALHTEKPRYCHRPASDHTLPQVVASPCTFLSSETRLKRAETTYALAIYCCGTNYPTHGS